MPNSLPLRKWVRAVLPKLGLGELRKKGNSEFARRRATRVRPFLEALETRLAPSTLYWDPGHTNGTHLGGSGSWDISSPQWWNGSADVAWKNSDNSTAVFAGNFGTVSENYNILQAGALQFDTSGYTLSFAALTLTSGNISVTS